MAITLPHNLTAKTLARASEVMANFNALVAALEGVGAAQTGADIYQAGVLAPTDWAPTGTVASGTGILTEGPLGGAAWLPGPSGALVRTFTASTSYSLKPPVLPGPSGYMTIGIELTASGAEAVPSLVSGAEKATEAEAREAPPAISAGKIRIADFILHNTAGAYTSLGGRDRRRYALGLERCIIAGEDSTASTIYTTLEHLDRVEVTVPENGLVEVGYQALWASTSATTIKAALFVDGTQVKLQPANGTAPAVQEASSTVGSSGAGTLFFPLNTIPAGLISSNHTEAINNTGDVTTGQILGSGGEGGTCKLFMAAGTHNISVAFKVTSGAGVKVKGRKLWAKVLA